MQTSKKLLIASAAALVAAGIAAFVLNRRVNRALRVEPNANREVDFVALPERSPLPFWGSEDVDAVMVFQRGVYAAGAFGVARLELPQDARTESLDRVDVSLALPSRRVSALAAWRTDIAAGLDDGGLFIHRDGSWFEVRSGFGTLHVRTIRESSAGELFIGAREGAFRLGVAERSMARLHGFPVKALALPMGGRVLSGGEQGLFLTQGGVTSRVAMESATTPWIDDVVVFDQRIFAVTPMGLLGEGRDGVLRSIASGENAGSVAVLGDHLFATADPPDSALRRFDRGLHLQLEHLPSAVRRVFAAGDRLMADTEGGLAERSNGAWRVVSKRRQQGRFGHAHIGALASFRDRLMIGFFDGGLAELAPPAHREEIPASAKGGLPVLQRVDGNAPGAVWAVNALLDAGGALHLASLRGAFRFDGSRFTPIEGSGAAFSLAQTRGGIAIGYGDGVLLPQQKLLSAFHGLPGNQATALAAVEGGLLVGTPSGLGYVEGGAVRWRVASGEGKLPHPFVTALLPVSSGVLIGTNGGGVTRRVGSMSDGGVWRPFLETEGLKVSGGCLIQANGRVYAGTDGNGLYRLSLDGSRFERIKLTLPSERITALFEWDGHIYIGTDGGLTRWPAGG